MTGSEIVPAAAAAKVVKAVGKNVLTNDPKVQEAVLEAAKEAPEMKAAGRTLAKRTAVKELVLLRLYQPFARMLGVSKSYFEDTFPEEMAAKIAGIPPEHIATPSPSIAVPVLQGLSYTFEEPSLKALFLNLLRTASDDRVATQAHPAFAEIIKQLSASETLLLSSVLRENSVTAARLKRITDRTASPVRYLVVMNHLLPLADSTTSAITEDPQVPTWVDNWDRLGLVDVSYMTYRAAEDAYDWVLTRPEYLRYCAEADENTIDFDKGIISATDFGRQFFCAVS